MMLNHWWKLFVARLGGSRLGRRRRLTSRWAAPLPPGGSAVDVPCALSFERLEDRTLLSTLTVNSLANDITGGNGLVTLREAIIAANTNTGTDGGGTGAAGLDQIVFIPGLTGTIFLTLAAGQMAITEDLTITGNGRTNTIIDAQSLSRIFDISAAPAAVTLNGLDAAERLGHGNGGAIQSAPDGTDLLTIRNSTLSGNDAVGGASDGGARFGRKAAPSSLRTPR